MIGSPTGKNNGIYIANLQQQTKHSQFLCNAKKVETRKQTEKHRITATSKNYWLNWTHSITLKQSGVNKQVSSTHEYFCYY